MNDERYLRDWLRDTTDPTVDPNAAADEVGARLARIPRRRRWLPWPLVDRTKTNDTRNRRTRSMLSPSQAFAASGLALALGTAFLVAQLGAGPDDTVRPAAEVVASGETTVFEGSLSYGYSRQAATSEVLENGVVVNRDQVWEIRSAETSDPRFGGVVTNTWNWDDYPASDAHTLWTGGWHIENDAGGWQQRPVAQLEFPDGTYSTYTAVFDGAGDYEGLIAVVEVQEANGFSLRGMIIDGDLPPAPSLLQESATP